MWMFIFIYHRTDPEHLKLSLWKERTNKVKFEKPETLKKVAKSAAIGAVIDGKDGAKRSAAIRGGIEMVKKGQQINIDKDSLIEFRLMQPLTIKSGS